MGYIRWFLSFLKKYRVRMIVGLILVFITALLVLINPQISGMIVDEVIEGQHYEKLGILLLIMIGVTLVRSLLRFTFLMCFESSSQGLVYDMREEAYRKLMKEDFNFFNKNRTGDLMSRQTGDMDAVRHMVSHVIYFSFENILVFLMALVMIFSVNVKMALCMLIVLPFTLAVTLSQRRHIKPAFDRVRDCFSSLNAFAQETIAGNRVVKAFAKEDYELEKFDRENDGYRDAQLNAASIWMKYIPMFEILSQCLTIILMIMGGFMVIDGEMTIGNMVTVNGYLWMLNSPLRQAGWIINDLQRFLTAIEKIYKVYTTEPDIKQPEHVVEKRKLKGSVTFDHVNYYTNDDGSYSFSNRVQKAYSFFATNFENKEISSEFEYKKLSDCYYRICSFYKTYILSSATVEEASRDNYEELISTIENALDDVKDAGAYDQLTLYNGTFMLLYDQRSSMVQVNVDKSTVLALLDRVYNSANTLSVKKEQSQNLQKEIIDNYDEYKEAIERAYTNAEERADINAEKETK